MNFDEGDGDIISLLLVESCITKLLNILPTSRRSLVWVIPLGKHISSEPVSCYIISELKLQDRFDYRRYFRMTGESFYNFLSSV